MRARNFLALLIAGVATIGVTANAAPEVTNLHLVSSERIDRTTFAYTYRIEVDNDLPGLEGTVATVTSSSPATVIVDDAVSLGTLPIGTMTSTDTFTLHQDRTVAFDPAALDWDFAAKIQIIVSGQVRDGPIGEASVILSVEGTGLNSFMATADDSGFYTRSVEGTGLNDFVRIEATGVDDQSFVTLTGLVGSMGSLLADAGTRYRGRGGSTPTVSSVDVTHITTALRVLAEAAAGGPISSDAELAAAAASVDSGALITLAAIIKTVVDNPAISLPDGITDTLALAMSPTVGAFGSFLAATFPDEYSAAVEATSMEVRQGFAAGEIPQLRYLTVAGDPGVTSSGLQILNLAAGGAGSINHFYGEADVAWTLNESGELEVVPATPLLIGEFLEFLPDLEIEVPVRFTIEAIKLTRFEEGPQFDRAYELTTTRKTYPENPEIPDVVTVDEPAPISARLLFDADQTIPFTAAELTAGQWAMDYFHRDNDSIVTDTNRAMGNDLLTFVADGTGTTQRRAFTFDWTLVDGNLNINFANGDRTTVIRLVQEGTGVFTGVLTAAPPEGAVQTRRSFVIQRDPAAVFDVAGLTDKRYRASWAGSVFSSLDIFDFAFFPDGLSCRNPGSEFAPDWRWVVTDGRLELTRGVGPAFIPSFGEPALSYRTWQLVRVNGNRRWVIETLQFNEGPRRDPATAPGRANGYNLEQDLAFNAEPTAGPDFFNTLPGVTLPIPQENLFDNDVDSDGDQLRIIDFDDATSAGGTVDGIFSAGGNLVGLQYQPPGKFTGVDLFSYFVTDSFCEPFAGHEHVISVDPASTYLTVHPTDLSGTSDAVAVDLEALGYSPGDTIRLNAQGAFDCCAGSPDENYAAVAVFSSSNVLAAPEEAHRVVGAIDAGIDWGTVFDIPEDFSIFYFDRVIRIPDGARYLFVAPDDSFFSDNNDLDGDYGIGISRVRGARGSVSVDVSVPEARPIRPMQRYKQRPRQRRP